jgi:KaiC/GvpD/RAD55 family RecA-like ATPase
VSDAASAPPYAVARLPIDGIRPGSTVLVAGPTHGGARTAALRMLAGGPGEGAILVTTNQRAARFVEDCQRAGIEVGEERAAIIDCVGDEDSGVPARLLPVSGPADLTGIGMRFSDVYMDFKQDGVARVRTGLFSLSTLLTLGDLQTVSRFVHTLAGRIDSVDGMGVLLVDPSNHDEQAVNTIAQFCAGRIDVRETDDGPALRVGGLAGHDREWRSFEI